MSRKKIETNPEQRCIVYTRFSPRRNEDESESCETQLDLCKGYALAREWQIGDWFADKAVSGGDDHKPEQDKAIAALGKGDVLLVYKRDRLARSVLLAELIRRRVMAQGARIVAVSGDIDGEGPEVEMVRQVLAAVAELERKMIGQRTRDAMKRHQAAGRRMGRYAPYGYRIDPDDDTRLVENEDEQAAIKVICDMKRRRFKVTHIVRMLNDEFPECARTGKWNFKCVAKVLEREGIE